MCFGPSILVLGEYFKERLVLANAVSNLGISTGQLILPLLISFLIATYGWRGFFLINGAVYMHLLLSAAIFRPNGKKSDDYPRTGVAHSNNLADEASQNTAPSTNNTGPNKGISGDTSDKATVDESNTTTGPSLCQKLRQAFGVPGLCVDLHFVLTILTILTMSMSNFGANTFLVPRAENADIKKEKSALLMSCVGIGGVVGRLGHGIIVDRGYVTAGGFFMIAMVTACIETCLIPVLDNFAFLVCLSLLFGVSAGIISPLCVIIPRQVMSSNPELVTPAVGLSMLVATVGQSLGAILAGLYNVCIISNSYYKHHLHKSNLAQL